MVNTLRVAAFQRRQLFGDIPRTVERLSSDLTWCDDQGVALAIFPECYLQGYASDRQTIAQRAIPLEGETMATVLSRLAPYHTALVLGLVIRHQYLLRRKFR